MGASYQDTFSGTNGSPLGTIEIGGVAWQVLTGTWTRTNGLAATTTAASSNPLAVIDVGWGDIDQSINVAGAGGGDALYFRVVDASNWLRARANVVVSGYSYGPYVQSGPYALAPGDDAYMNPAYSNATVVVSDTEYEVFNSGPTSYYVYTRSKTTSYAYSVVVEKSVAGTVSTIGSVASAAQVTAIRMVATASTLTLYIDGASSSSGVFVDGTNATATKHGIGRGVSSVDASAIDNFSLQPLNRPPNAPVLTFPTGNVQLDSTVTQRFAWQFSDPDPGDSQSKVNIYYRIVGTSTWTEVTDATPNWWHDFAGGTFAAGSYEWQAETYDAAGHLGTRSASSFFTVATPPAGPSWTSPVNNATITTASQVFDWSSTSQDSYQVRKVADSSGVANTSTVYFDTGEVVDSAARTITLSFPVNSRTEHVQIRVKVSGLWSNWTDSIHPVSYTPPAAPLIVVSADNATASISVDVTQPTPGAGQPSVVSCDIWSIVVDPVTGVADASTETRLATGLPANANWTYWFPASGVSYQFNAVGIAANGTSTPSAWAPGPGSSTSPGSGGTGTPDTYTDTYGDTY